MIRPLPLIVALAALTSPALASSEDAWAAFRQDVARACAALVPVPEGGALTVEVNPFGSERFGAALVTLTLADTSADRMICIYDKSTRAAEITAPFAVARP